MKVYSYYATDEGGEYFSRFLEPIEVNDRAEAERLGAKLVADAKASDCVTAAYYVIEENITELQ